MKIVVNRCWGGFGLSKLAYEKLGISWDGYGHGSHIERNDPKLVAVVEELGEAANGDYAKLRIVEIPEGVDWEIDNYDGQETVRERHRSW